MLRNAAAVKFLQAYLWLMPHALSLSLRCEVADRVKLARSINRKIRLHLLIVHRQVLGMSRSRTRSSENPWRHTVLSYSVQRQRLHCCTCCFGTKIFHKVLRHICVISDVVHPPNTHTQASPPLCIAGFLHSRLVSSDVFQLQPGDSNFWLICKLTSFQSSSVWLRYCLAPAKYLDLSCWRRSETTALPLKPQIAIYLPAALLLK